MNSCISNFFGPYSKMCIVKVRAAWGCVSRGLTVQTAAYNGSHTVHTISKLKLMIMYPWALLTSPDLCHWERKKLSYTKTCLASRPTAYCLLHSSNFPPIIKYSYTMLILCCCHAAYCTACRVPPEKFQGPVPFFPSHQKESKNLLTLNPKQKYFFNSRKGFLRQSHLSTFIHLDKHLDGAWDKFWIQSQNGTFIALQMKAFGPKIFMQGLKSAILAVF